MTLKNISVTKPANQAAVIRHTHEQLQARTAKT